MAKETNYQASQMNMSPLELNFTEDLPPPLIPEHIPSQNSQAALAINVLDPDFDPDELPSPNSNFF